MRIQPVISQCVMPKEIFYAGMWKKDTEYLDDSVYEICVSPFARKGNALQIHLGAFENGEVLSFAGLNKQLSDRRAEAYFGELEKQFLSVVSKCFEWEDGETHDVVISYGSMVSKKGDTAYAKRELRLVIMVKDSLPMEKTEEEMVRKKLKGELLNWMEEVRHDVQLDHSEKYAKDYRAILSVELLHHEQDRGDILNTLAIISAAILFVSYFLMDWFFFQIIAFVFAGYTAFRAAQKKKYVCMSICLVIAAVSLAFCLMSYQDLKESMKNVDFSSIKR